MYMANNKMTVEQFFAKGGLCIAYLTGFNVRSFYTFKDFASINLQEVCNLDFRWNGWQYKLSSNIITPETYLIAFSKLQ